MNVILTAVIAINNYLDYFKMRIDIFLLNIIFFYIVIESSCSPIKITYNGKLCENDFFNKQKNIVIDITHYLYFNNNNYKVYEKSKGVFDTIVKCLQNSKYKLIEISIYYIGDSIDIEESSFRAAEIRNLLLAKGLENKKVTTKVILDKGKKNNLDFPNRKIYIKVIK